MTSAQFGEGLRKPPWLFRLNSPPRMVTGPILDRGEVNETKRHYETLYIVSASTTEEQLDSIISKYNQVVTDQGGEVVAAGRWDRRRLAYEIKGQREGIYLILYFLAEPSVSKEVDRVMRISEEVIRHMTVTVEPEHIEASRIKTPVAEEAQAETPAEEPAQEVTVAPEAEAEAVAEEPVEAPVEETQPEVKTEEVTEEQEG